MFIVCSCFLILAELSAYQKNCCRPILKAAQQWHWFPRTTMWSCRDLAMGNLVSPHLNPLRSNGAMTALSINTLTLWTRNTPMEYHHNNFLRGSWLIAAQRSSHAMQWLYASLKSAVYSDLISFISLSLATMWFEIFEALWSYLHLFPHLFKNN